MTCIAVTARTAPRRTRGGEHGPGQCLVIGRQDGPQVQQQPAVLDPPGDRAGPPPPDRVPAAQHRRQVFGQAHGGAGQRHAGGAAAADGALRRHRAGVDSARAQGRRDLLGPPGQRGGVGGQRLRDRRGRPGQGRLQRGQGQLVHPQGPGQRVPARARGPGRPRPSSSPAWGPPSSLSPLAVTSAAPSRSAVCASGSPGSSGCGASSPEPMSDDDRDGRAEGRASSRTARLGGEPLDAEVRRVHLERERRVRAGRGRVVGDRRPVGRADLAQPRPGRLEQVGQPEPVADLDHLAAADQDLAPGGQRGRGQHQGGGVVVDHVHALGGRTAAARARQRPAAPAPAGPAGQVELHVGVARRGDQGVGGRADSGARPRLVCSTTPVALSTGSGWPRSRQRSQRGVGDALRRDLPARAWSCARATAAFTRSRPRRPLGLGQPRIGEQRVGARHETPGVHAGDLRLRLTILPGHCSVATSLECSWQLSLIKPGWTYFWRIFLAIDTDKQIVIVSTPPQLPPIALSPGSLTSLNHIVNVNGQPASEISNVYQHTSPGHLITYTVQQNDKLMTFAYPAVIFTRDMWLESYGLTFIAGICWILVGFILLARAPN